MKTAVITGSSSGIGEATSLYLARNGFRVFAGMRDPRKGQPLQQAAEESGLAIELVQMDVCDPDSVSRAFAGIEAKVPVDVLVNNAGISGSSPLEDTPEHEHKAIFETNYFGAVRCVQAVVGSMRERNTGCIVNISSAAGLFATPTQIPYSASKWAVECMSEALAHELRPFGVRVVSIEPGVVKTNIFENSAEMTHFDKASPYARTMRRIGRLFATGLQHPTSPEQVAAIVLESITARDFRLRWPVGTDAVKFHGARARISAEEWICLADERGEEEYAAGFKKLFGIDL